MALALASTVTLYSVGCIFTYLYRMESEKGWELTRTIVRCSASWVFGIDTDYPSALSLIDELGVGLWQRWALNKVRSFHGAEVAPGSFAPPARLVEIMELFYCFCCHSK